MLDGSRTFSICIRNLPDVVDILVVKMSKGTSETTYLSLQGRNLGLLISTIATTGFLLFGYDQGVMSGIIASAPFNTYFPETLGSSIYQGFVTAIYEVGCLFGAIFSLAYGEFFGRRKMVRQLSKDSSKNVLMY